MNREELRTILDQKGVSRTSYTLTGNVLTVAEKNGTYALEFVAERKRWLVCEYIGGERTVIGGFYSEAGACEKLYFALTNTNKDFAQLLENLPFEKPRNLRDEVYNRDLKDWLLMNAGATPPCLVVNVTQLKELLLEKGVPRSAYSILGDNVDGLDPNGGRLLEYNQRNNYWSLSIYEGGESGYVYASCPETMACTMLYYLLVDGLHKASRPLGEPRPMMKTNRNVSQVLDLSKSTIKNCDELDARLIEAGVRGRCTLPSDPTRSCGWALEYNLREKTWDFFHYERGEKYLERSFYWESTACEEMYSVAIRYAGIG
ncbi:MAG: hypothetical protein IJL92_10300 [Thermoguttaceae bacterium]|nr:hypothetical protein [Thermoguttaceae bacterium]